MGKKPKNPKQLQLIKPGENACGGSLRNKAKGRTARALSTKDSMHLVLRSSKATHLWSFKRPENERAITGIIARFSQKYGVRILQLANVGNHLHLRIQLTNRFAYIKWIRAITAAIAMKITGINRWTGGKNSGERFWDYRPYTRIVRGFRAVLRLKDYIRVNRLEGLGISRKLLDIRRFAIPPSSG